MNSSADRVLVARSVSVTISNICAGHSRTPANASHLDLGGAVPIIRVIEEEIDIAHHACGGVQGYCDQHSSQRLRSDNFATELLLLLREEHRQLQALTPAVGACAGRVWD